MTAGSVTERSRRSDSFCGVEGEAFDEVAYYLPFDRWNGEHGLA